MNEIAGYIECQVCKDSAVGFHCGAHVCEACKKFFIRCLKLRCGEKFRCSSTGRCSINKGNRTKCPCCRYKKCLQLNMYGPGSQNVSKEINHMPCQVCGAPSSGFHFGAITCEGCKGFFRRCLWDKNIGLYKCIENGVEKNKCQVTWKTRNTCKFCRYNRCLTIGMESNKSRIGRQSNLVKHKIHMALNKIKMAKGLSVDNIFPIVGSTKQAPKLLHKKDSAVSLDEFYEISKNGIKIFENEKVFVDVKSLPAETEMPIPSSSSSSSNPSSSFSSYSSISANLPFLCYRTNSSSTDSSLSSPFVTAVLFQSVSQSQGKYVDFTPRKRNCEDDRKKNNHEYKNQSRNALLVHHDVPKFTVNLREMNFGSFPFQNFQNKMSELSTLELTSYQSPDILRNPVIAHKSLVELMLEIHKYLDPVSERYEAFEMESSSSCELIWEFEMAHLVRCVKLILQFAWNVPGFEEFSLNEQISVIGRCMFPLASLLFAIASTKERRAGFWFGISCNQQQNFLEMFEVFKHFFPHYYELCNYVSRLDLDKVEISFVCALYLMDVGNRYDYKEFLLDHLEAYIKSRCGPRSDRHFLVFKCFYELNQLSNLHNHVVKLFKINPKYGGLIMPNLLIESVVRQSTVTP